MDQPGPHPLSVSALLVMLTCGVALRIDGRSVKSVGVSGVFRSRTPRRRALSIAAVV